MGVASGCSEQEAGVASGRGWNLWVWLYIRRYIIYRFPHTTYPYSSCICSFLQQHPYFFLHFFNVFLSCLQAHLINNMIASVIITNWVIL